MDNFEGEFRRRKQRIRDGWILVASIMVLLPLGGQIILGLWYTFIAFAYLDEKPYNDPDKYY